MLFFVVVIDKPTCIALVTREENRSKILNLPTQITSKKKEINLNDKFQFDKVARLS